MSSLRATGDRVIVEVLVYNKLSNIIKIPDNVTRPLQKHVKARVVSVGPRVKFPLKIGDIILVDDYTGIRLSFEGKEYRGYLTDPKFGYDIVGLCTAPADANSDDATELNKPRARLERNS